MGTFIVGMIVLAIVVAIVNSLIKNKKAGKSIACSGDCKHCGGSCSHE